MNSNAVLDGFMVHPLDLFPTNKNLPNGYNKISTNTANLDGFKVHPIDLFVSHDNSYNNYNLTNNITANYGIINSPQNTNISYIPYSQTTNVGTIFNNYKNPRTMEVYQNQINSSPYYTTQIPTKVETYQRNDFSFVPIPTNIETKSTIDFSQTTQNYINTNYTQQTNIVDNSYNYINLPSRTIINSPQKPETLYNNYPSSNTIINQTSPYEQTYNFNPTSITETTYQNYPLTNNITYVNPPTQTNITNNTVNYLPTEPQTTNLNTTTTMIPPYSLVNLNQNVNEQNKLFSINTAQYTPNNMNINYINQNPGDALLDLLKTAPTINKNIPYTTASYEPDTNQENITRTNIDDLRTYFNSPPIKAIPQDTLQKNEYSTTKGFERMKTTVIVPTKTSIIVPTKKTIIIPKKTTVIVPNIKTIIINNQNSPNIITNQYVPSNVNNNIYKGERTNIFLSPSTSSLMTNNYSTNTLSGLPRAASHISYNPRPLALNNVGTVYPKNNSSMYNTNQNRGMSSSPVRYRVNTFYKNSKNHNNSKTRISLLKNGNPIYNPRNYFNHK